MTVIVHVFGVLAAGLLLAAVAFERREAPTWIPLVLGADGVLAGLTAVVIGGQHDPRAAATDGDNNRYSTMRYTRHSLVASIVQDQLADVVSGLPRGHFGRVKAGVLERLVDGQLQRHRLLRSVADAVAIPVAKPIVGIELVEGVDAGLINPDREGVARLIAHARRLTGSRQKTAGRAAA